jgi:glycosyltransferase A (GT-A) superfamily protein (DUF2064 family)
MADALVMVAKYPTAGKCKTRLSKATGSDYAAEFAMCATKDLVERLAMLANDSCRLRLILLFAPKEREEDFRAMLSDVPGLAFDYIAAYGKVTQRCALFRWAQMGALGNARQQF